MKNMNPVVHFELPSDDKKRMIKFYSSAFGWECNEMGDDMSNYVVVMTDESDKNGPKEKGRINGGFFQRSKGEVPSVVIGVEDIKEHIEIVKKAGGKVDMEPVEIPGVGLYAHFTDTEGNKLSMLQPTNMK